MLIQALASNDFPLFVVGNVVFRTAETTEEAYAVAALPSHEDANRFAGTMNVGVDVAKIVAGVNEEAHDLTQEEIFIAIGRRVYQVFHPETAPGKGADEEGAEGEHQPDLPGWQLDDSANRR